MDNKLHRRSIRIKGYDYSENGYYHVTICADKRKLIFGKIENGKMILSQFGLIVENVLKSLPDHHDAEIDIYTIVPNHVHCILMKPYRRGIARNAPTNQFGNVPAGSISCIMRSFKSECTKQIREMMKNPNYKFWQRNFYEHVIRNEIELSATRQYILNNPLKWQYDHENPDCVKLKKCRGVLQYAPTNCRINTKDLYSKIKK